MLQEKMLNILCLRHISIFFLIWTYTISHLLNILFYEMTNLANEWKCSKSTEKLTVDSIAL